MTEYIQIVIFGSFSYMQPIAIPLLIVSGAIFAEKLISLTRSAIGDYMEKRKR
jgi:hypothetical protein